MNRTPKRRIGMVVRRYQEGKTRREIAIELGMKSETVKKILEEQGFEFIPQRRNKLTPEQEQQVIARYPEVQSGTILGKEFGCDRATILNIVKRAGLTPRGRGNIYRRVTPEQIEQMVSLYEGGMSQAKIAVAVGTSQPKVSELLIARGVRPQRVNHRNENSPLWKGGRVKVGRYVGVKPPEGSPYTDMAWNRGGYVLEHRLVMAEALGRSLHEWESVHHIDGDPSNNDLSNLQLRIGKHGKHIQYVCADCGSHRLKSVDLT